MFFLKKKITKEKIESRILLIIKKIVHLFGKRKSSVIPIFIMGYGRSGSTMLFKIFDRDIRLSAFGENHPAVAEKFILNYDLLQKTVKNSKTKIIVCKPILNSFEIKKLISKYPNGIYIWLVRDFQDVVSSAIKKFGNLVAEHLKDYILYESGENWISNGLSNETKIRIQNISKSNHLDSEDWMALVWWAVNSTIFNEELYKLSNLFVVRYEDLVSNPTPFLKNVYRRTGISYHNYLGKYVHKKSVGKGKQLKLNKNVFELCTDLNTKIEAILDYREKKGGAMS
nr:sulfotransferase [uncultured Desulfobacter sp.]